jgi:hypothetical protein
VTVVLMTSLIGTILVSMGAGLAVMAWLPELLPGSWPSSGYVAGGIAGGLLLGGILFQSVGGFRARRAGRGEAEGSEGKGGKSSGRGGGAGE